MQVRAFAEPDRQALRALYVASRNAAFQWAPPGAHKAEDFDRATAGERILVADYAGRLLGFASVWMPDSFLHNLFVHPGFIRCGIGRRLLEACGPLFADTPTLKCLRANLPAQRFYLSQGWRVVGEGDSPEGPYLRMAFEPD